MRNACLATLIGFILVVFLTLFIIAVQVKVLATPNFIFKVIKESQILNNLGALTDEVITSGQQQDQGNLNSTVLTKVLIKSIKPSEAENELHNLINAFSAYFQGTSSNLDITIDLRDLKTNFVKEWVTTAPSLYRSEYEKLRVCENNESPQKMVGDEPIIDCQSPDLSAAALEEQARQADLEPFLKTIPDEFSLSDWSTKNQDTLNKIRLIFNVLNLVFWGSLILSLLCVVSFIALGWPNGRAISGWIGWVFVIVAGPIFVLDLLSPMIIQNLGFLQGTQLNAATAQILNPLVESVNRLMVRSTFTFSAVILGLGVVLVILSFVLPKYEPRIIPPGFKEKLSE